jgi:hypothetical protein
LEEHGFSAYSQRLGCLGWEMDDIKNEGGGIYFLNDAKLKQSYFSK